jgi:CheY-like chemotaxis protein
MMTDGVRRHRGLPEAQGFDVTVADGGEAGMVALKERSFDVMLTTSSCPICAASNRSGSFTNAHQIPIIAMSGYAFANAERAPDFLRMTLELGATRCLRKPFTPQAPVATVSECLGRSAASTRLLK